MAKTNETKTTGAQQEDQEKYLNDSVCIEPVALEEEFVRLPADLAYWGAQYANAVRDYLRADFQMDKMEAALAIKWRETLIAKGDKVTEKMVEAAVLMDPAYEEAKLHLVSCEANKEHKRAACDAVKAKRDMLISLGANQRAEMASDPTVRAQAREARVR